MIIEDRDRIEAKKYRKLVAAALFMQFEIDTGFPALTIGELGSWFTHSLDYRLFDPYDILTAMEVASIERVVRH